MVRNPDAADNLCVLPDVDIIADDRGVVRVAAVAADATVAVDDAPFTYARFGIHDDGTEVLQMKVLSEAAGTNDEAQPGAEAVLAPTIPETEHFVGRSESVLLFFTKKTQIPLDVVHFGTDPPFEESFFQGHRLKNKKALSFDYQSVGPWCGELAVPLGRASPGRTR